MKKLLFLLISFGLVGFYIKDQNQKIKNFREECAKFISFELPKLPGKQSSITTESYLEELLKPTLEFIQHLKTNNWYGFLTRENQLALYELVQNLKIEQKRYRYSNSPEDSIVCVMLKSSAEKKYRKLKNNIQGNLNQSSIIIWIKCLLFKINTFRKGKSIFN